MDEQTAIRAEAGIAYAIFQLYAALFSLEYLFALRIHLRKRIICLKKIGKMKWQNLQLVKKLFGRKSFDGEVVNHSERDHIKKALARDKHKR